MACQMLVANSCNLQRGRIVVIVDSDHVFSPKETLSSHLAAGLAFEDFKRYFSLIKFTDKTVDELSYLLEYNEKGENKYYFNEPDRSSSDWLDLYRNGEVVRTFDEISKYLVENA